jgi:hypothetical protein
MIRRLAVPAVAISLVLAGCGSKSDSGSGSGSGSGSTTGDPVAWAEKVCKSVEADVTLFTTPPNIDPSDPAKQKDGIVAYLGNLSTALDHFISGVKAAGPPPVADGQQAMTKMTDAFTAAKKTIDDAKSNIEKANTTDPAAFQEAFKKVGDDLSGLEDPTKDLKSSQALNDAFDKAPTCKKMDSSTSGSSSAPTS